jgi:hypothetical protein
MSMSRRTAFLSEIISGQQIPLGTRSFFQERFRSRLYDLVVSEFLKQEQASGLTRAEVARRIGRKPEQITRWLGAPGNWTVETVSDLLLAISKAEPAIGLSPLDGRPARNFDIPDWARIDQQIGSPNMQDQASRLGATQLPKNRDEERINEIQRDEQSSLNQQMAVR